MRPRLVLVRSGVALAPPLRDAGAPVMTRAAAQGAGDGGGGGDRDGAGGAAGGATVARPSAGAGGAVGGAWRRWHGRADAPRRTGGGGGGGARDHGRTGRRRGGDLRGVVHALGAALIVSAGWAALAVMCWHAVEMVREWVL